MLRTRSAGVLFRGLAAFLVAAGWGSSAQAQPVQSVTALDLLKAHRAGKAAVAAYEGKQVEVTGAYIHLFAAINDGWGRRSPALQLRTQGSNDEIICELPVSASPEIAKLNKEQKLVVTGVPKSGNLMVQLNGCAITKLIDPVRAPMVSMTEPTETVPAETLLRDYMSNPVAATLKYRGKSLQISGKLLGIVGQRLKMQATTYNLLFCTMNSPVTAFLQSLPPNPTLVIKGQVHELDSTDLVVKDCSLVEPAPPAAPAAPAAPTAPTPTAPAPTAPAAPTAPTPAAPTAPAPTAPAPAAPVRWKAVFLVSYSPTAVHAGGSWTMTGVAGGVTVQVRQDEKDGSPTRGTFFIAVAGGPERPMNKAELRALYDGTMVRAKSPTAAPFDKDLVRALAPALGIRVPKLP